MSKKTSKRNQKIYKMKGCSKKTRKNYLGGSTDINLAYTGKNIHTVPNPFLSYTGKGGTYNIKNSFPSLATNINTNGVDKTLPNTGPINTGSPATPFLNPIGNQNGGSCGVPFMKGGCGCDVPLMKGGCGSCGVPFMKGGKYKKGNIGFMVGGKRHRIGCKCSSCKTHTQLGGNQGIPYPNGLIGSPWTPSSSGWPGVSGIQGDNNFLAPNNYKTDVQTSIISTGAQRPFSVGGSKKKTRKQKGGNLSNFLGQDLINLGRQFQFGLGSAYNGLAGYASPVNPMPWKGQLPNTPSLSTVRAASL